jgi:hypothetical protein
MLDRRAGAADAFSDQPVVDAIATGRCPSAAVDPRFDFLPRARARGNKSK